MLKKVFGCVFFIILSSFAANVRANENELLSAIEIERAGLTREWFTRVGVDSSRSEVMDLKLVVNSEKKSTVYDLRYGRYHEHYTADDLGPDGMPLGPERLQQYLDVRKDVLQKQYGPTVEVKIESFEIQDSTLYALTSQSIIQAIDANSGATLWATRVGNANSPAIGFCANKQYVAVVVGSFLYCLDAKDGTQLWSRSCRSAPGAGPAISDTFIYVPMINGFVEVFSLETNGIKSAYFVSSGRANIQPTVHNNTVAWPTDRGHLNVAPNFKTGSLFYRLKTDSVIVARSSAQADLLYVATIDGAAYALNESAGSLQWKLALGESISEPVVPIGKDAYIVTDANNLHRVDSQFGFPSEQWPNSIPGITSFLAASNNRLYCMDQFQRIAVINHADGSRIASINAIGQDLRLINMQTDRIFVGTRSGMIQCLREIGNEYVIYHSDKLEALTPDRPIVPVEEKKDETIFEKDDSTTDPFGTKSGAGKTEEKTDPFGTGGAEKKSDDPFDTGGKKEDDKPKKSEDPFATGK